MPFAPGQSGNPAGPGKAPRRFLETLHRALDQEDAKRLRACVEKLLDLAADGEQWAAQMLADRLDGKAHQTISGPEDRDLIPNSIEVRHVGPSDGSVS